ncbi:CAAX amino terminal protease family [Xenococcus sp. PCC 7305]|uniref:CPBP family intramembrane glutamic endopeptidase n=1 Tax=Xenococcus sp. PCC 7305 TaxID=102125 RepID=UPI0002AC56B0|nr:CAAX amino terminal protease family [Xenococcus sp. PCC 7305]
MLLDKLHLLKTKSVWLRLIGFLVCLLIIWLPLAIPLNSILTGDRNLATIIIMSLLLVDFIALQKLWGKYVYQQPKIFTSYGLVANRLNFIELFSGLAIGVGVCWSLFFIEAILGWVTINPIELSLVRIIIEGFISALGIGVAEELVFRGWLLKELEQDFSKNKSLWLNSLIFALAHFIKPLGEIIRTFVTFPAYIILSSALVWAKWSKRDRLGIAIGLHSGLVWGYYILNVGNLLTYTEQVPDWVTGIDGNPIAGILGLIFLTGLAILMRTKFLALAPKK